MCIINVMEKTKAIKLSSSPKLNYLLHQMGIWNYYDVIKHLPRRYENFSLTGDTNLEDKQRVVLYGDIVSILKVNRGRKATSTSFDFISSNKKYFKVIAYNRPYLNSTFKVNDQVTITGIYNRSRNEIDMINISKGLIDQNRTIRPIYSLPKDYPNHSFIQLVNKALNELSGKIYTEVPYYYVNKYRLVNKEEAMKNVHQPKNFEDIRQALRYLKYEEALNFSLRNQIIHNENRSLSKIKKEPIDFDICKPFIDSLPYQLTEDQVTAATEIINDMNDSSLMYRLLQGDVGTGKTLVSFIALYANYLRGDQGALMAPTDALARQHYENAKKLFEGTKIKIALLVGATKPEDKRRIYDDLQDGYIDIVIGTHALFTKSVNYSSLGLVIIDEQHRFGVNQRIALANKGENADLLMMSATPIPRSLALSIYGDLDISTLTSFPARKRDVVTRIFDSEDERLFKAVDLSLSQGKQVYIVAPLIEFRENARYSVEQLYARYILRYHEKVGLLHGKLKPEEKELALTKFYTGETPILVTTQVIEVGIDVKSANLMIIYDAAGFGLASLHQLRGRIGRDGSKAYCLLTHDDETDEEAISRLNVLVNTEDGFEIAEEDLKLRGPGDLVGIKQSGLPDFAYLNVVDDLKIFITARDDAKNILKHKDDNKSFAFIVDRVKKQISVDELKKG